MNAREKRSDASAKPQAAGSGDPCRAQPQAAGGRDARGRFAKGNAGGPGNPFARKVAQLRAALVNFVTEDDMKHIAFILKEKAMGGDLAAIKLLFQYVLGKPAEAVDPDRLDVDEWQKVQERALPPDEAAAVLERMPADMVCRLTNIAWPCAVEQNVAAPLRAGFQAMDEREARPAAGPGDTRRAPEPRRAPPATRWEDSPSPKGGTGGRGDAEPMANGPNGEEGEPVWWAELLRAARRAREEREGVPSTKGENGTRKRRRA